MFILIGEGVLVVVVLMASVCRLVLGKGNVWEWVKERLGWV